MTERANAAWQTEPRRRGHAVDRAEPRDATANMFGAEPHGEAFDLPAQGVRVCFVDTPNSQIELIEPLGRKFADREVPREEPARAGSITSASRSPTSRRRRPGSKARARASSADAHRCARDAGVLHPPEGHGRGADRDHGDAERTDQCPGAGRGPGGAPAPISCFGLDPGLRRGTECRHVDRQAPVDWEKLAAKESRGKDLSRETVEGIRLNTVYGPDDAAASTAATPASPPFTRGPYATMYAGRPWTIRQYAGFSTAEESNAFYRRNLAAGQKGLSASPSISRPTAATTATIRASRATSAWRASRSTRSRT